MSISRKEFFRRGCISGACLCGFGTFDLLANKSIAGTGDDATQDNNTELIQEWLSNLIQNMGTELDEEVLRKVIKKSAAAHYENLKMDEMLSDYIGDLESFIEFIEDKWGWKIDYKRDEKLLIADENKSHCVCPVLSYKEGVNSSAICYCSEGFAEKMFSKVAGVPVTATVIASIRKGDDRCKYEIRFP